MKTFVEGDIFRINGKEYALRLINKHYLCWLGPVLYRNDTFYTTGGLNKIYRYDELNELEYIK